MGASPWAARMRIGLIARADKTGLGVQTFNFWRNMKPAATLIVDLSHCSGQKPNVAMYRGGGEIAVWHDRTYPSIKPSPQPVVEEFLRKVDVVFTCETFYNYWVIERARELDVRTVLQPNYEFLDYLIHPDLPEPDAFALPSTWHIDDIRMALPGRDVRYVPVPIDRELLPYRHRPELRRILHPAGTPAAEDRNGTLLLIEAMRHVKSPVRAIVRSQKQLGVSNPPANVHIDRSDVPNYWDLYRDEDLMVMPRKFGGLCLPMQEALAVGMPVLASDVAPQREFLPEALRVSAPKTHEIMTRAMIGIHQANPLDLARRIDELHEDRDTFASLSSWTQEWAEAHTWDALRPSYEEVLGG